MILRIHKHIHRHLKKYHKHYLGGFGALGLVLMVISFFFHVSNMFADTNSTDFENFTLGDVNGQNGWVSGHGSSFCPVYDVDVVSNTYGYPSFGSQSLRISNAIACGSFNDQTFSKSLTDEAGETSAGTGIFSSGTRQPYFEAQRDFASTVTGSEQTGLSVVASADRGDTMRMTWLQMQDTDSGLQLNFEDYHHSILDFITTPIATGLDRTVPYTVKMTINFIDGPSNDVVKIYLNGVLIYTGTTWEDYFRDFAGGIPFPVDSIMFREAGTAVPSLSGKGFLIDNFSSASGPVPVSTATLHVVKQVVNDNNGTAIPSDFTLHVQLSGTDVLGSPVLGTGTPGTLYSLAAGTYTVSEATYPGSTSSFGGDCDSNGHVTLSVGDDKTCTITNTYVPVLTITENPSPVFSTLIPDQAYVIKDNVNYKLYYAGGDFASINLAQSPDGITWTPYSGNPVLADAGQEEHADVHFYSDGFAGVNTGTNPSGLTMYYRMWYQGPQGANIAGYRYAESPDGINWYNRMTVTQDVLKPVFGPGTPTNYGVADVVYTPGGEGGDVNKTFRIYANVQWEVGAYSAKELVVMAYSANGYNWVGYDPTGTGFATPVFEGTLDGTSFDTDHISWFKVIKNSATDWEAFYGGGKNSSYVALNGIGYATSTDGINRTRKQTLFTTNDPVAWRNQSVWMPSVVKVGNNYEIFFLGSNDESDGSRIWRKLGRAVLSLTTAPSPTPAPTGNGGGGGGTSKDYCPNGDTSPSFYDGTCTAPPNQLSGGISGTHAAAGAGDISNSPYSLELNDAYLYAYAVGITTMPAIQKANMEGTLIRSNMAKMMVNYAIKVLKMTPNTGLVCYFSDVSIQTPELKLYIKYACQLGLMGYEPDGKTEALSFNPNGEVSRAEFGTVLSRALYGNEYNGGTPYYLKHLQALKAAGIMNNITDPEHMLELRGYVMLMLMRADANGIKSSYLNLTGHGAGNILTPVVLEISYTAAEQKFINTLDKGFQFIFGYMPGSSDIGIKYLQYFLKANGYFTGVINGINTNATVASLFNRQKDKNIVQFPTDVGAGYLGPTTRGILNPLLKILLNQ